MSAHSAMRLTGVLALLLWAASTQIGSQAWAAEAHGKAVSNARTGSHRSTSKVNSKTSVRSRSKVIVRTGSGKIAGRRSRLHTATQATVRNARYTPERRASLSPQPATAPDYAAGYEQGYQAGLDAARRQLERNGTAGVSAARSPSIDDTNGSLPAPRETSIPRQSATYDSAGRSQAQRSVRRLALNETTETEVPETPPIDQIATLRVGGAGMPRPLRGSLASLERQNDRVEADGLERILDEADLDNRIAHKLLVPIPASASLQVNPSLSENHRYCRPWTAHFLADLARAHSAAFHTPIEVNSAVRTVDYQKRLMNTNGNAAAAEGDVVSPHLTGATVDIGKQGLSRKEMAWMRRQLLGLQEAGKIDVEEEFAQACFHITVYKSYTSSLPQRRNTQPAPSRVSAPERNPDGPAKRKPASQLPADLAVGVLGSQGR